MISDLTTEELEKAINLAAIKVDTADAAFISDVWLEKLNELEIEFEKRKETR